MAGMHFLQLKKLSFTIIIGIRGHKYVYKRIFLFISTNKKNQFY